MAHADGQHGADTEKEKAMTTPNPMSVVEALEEQRRQMDYPELPPAFALTMKRMLDEALPLARSMQEKLEGYDGLVKYKEALEWLIKWRYVHETYPNPEYVDDYPAIIREMLGGKHE